MRTVCKPQQVLFFLSLMVLLAAVSWIAVAAAPVPQPAFDCTNVTGISQSECEALVALYNSTNGPTWRHNPGWLTTSEPCRWQGVTCQNRHVTALDLSANALSGAIPPELGNLTNLQKLDLSANYLRGAIPPQLGNLANLQYLDLSASILFDEDFEFLTGAIPPEIGNLANLHELYLDNNDLSGAIPPELGNLANLEVLDLGWNDLTGAIPRQLGNLHNLQYLALNDSYLSGSIPPEFGKLTNLEVLYLGWNDLSGAIPPELGNLTNLEVLDLCYNALSGAIPPQLGNLDGLAWLALCYNALIGYIPLELSNLDTPLYLNLSFNALTATDDPDLLAWLAQKQPDWAETQTVAPIAVQASVPAADRIVVSWTPIRYTGDGGYYEVSYATAPAAPFTVHGVTPNKSSNQYTLTSLAPGTTYFVRVRTYTPPHRRNQNELWSGYSEVVMATTPGSDTGLINPGFESGVEGWRFHTDGVGALSKDCPGYRSVAAGRVDLTTAGGNTQLYQTGFTLTPNTRYRLQFFAKSSTGHDLSVYVHQHSNPYTNYGLSNFRVNLTPSWKRFTIDFTSKRFTAQTTDTRLRFWLTGLAKANDSYWFDDISLVELSPTLVAAQAQGVGEVQGLVQGATSPTTLQLVDSESEGIVYQITTVTDAAGHFQLTALPYGSYELRVIPPAGYLTPEAMQFAVSDDPNEELSFALTPITNTYFLPQISR